MELCAGWGCLVGRTKKGTEPGIAKATRLPKPGWCAADRRESVGQRVGKGLVLTSRDRLQGRPGMHPAKPSSIHPESSGSPFRVSGKRDMIK